ncbi:MAG: hypothetical protein K2N71_04330 [Oscillospiraceae bacterium]|nr:hypothetical protein [Oscillospiraceae bacterium]
MKINDIKKAYDSVSANGELKEKVFSRLYAETEDIPQTETFPIEIRKGGETRLRITSFVAAAAMIAMALIIGKLVFNVDISTNLPGDETDTTSETVEIPENTALVTLRILDQETGEPVKNVRIDYLPMIFTYEKNPEYPDWDTMYTNFDMENIEKAGTIPMTYGEDIELRIAYGEYNFYMSTALPNSQYRMADMGDQATIMYNEGLPYHNSVWVDENTTEIVLSYYDSQAQYTSPKLGVILRGADGKVLPDEYTVILKPKDGLIQAGYTNEYGGYVLTRTNENGEAYWRGTPIEGEYEIIAYKEKLHPISEPILEPFVFGDDNTIKYTQNDNVSIYEKTFKQAE